MECCSGAETLYYSIVILDKSSHCIKLWIARIEQNDTYRI